LKTFVAVVEHNSFLPVADIVGRSPSAISMQVGRLKDDLGVVLFLRNSKRTVLTREGEKLVVHARRLLQLEEKLRDEFSERDLFGEVTLGVPDDVILSFPMSIIQRFSEEHSGLTISLTVDHTPSLLLAISRSKIDLANLTYAEGVDGMSRAKLLYRESEVWAQLRGGVAAERVPLPVTVWERRWPLVRVDHRRSGQGRDRFQSIAAYGESICAQECNFCGFGCRAFAAFRHR
jgi:DNA-binding transcriptional LysR family regulator